MMYYFSVVNPKDEIVGYDSYDSNSDKWHVEMVDDYVIGTGPFMFDVWKQRGDAFSDNDSLNFVRMRIAPRERQGIQYLLADLGAKEYSELVMIQYTKGYCPVMDNCHFVQLDAHW